VKRELEHVEIPDEHGARERAWRLVSAAFSEREPAPARRRVVARRLVPAAAVAVAAAIVAAAVSPPGRALLHSIRETVGVKAAAPALFSLPTGRLLVHSDDGAWVVQADGSKRRLGSYRSASWSPHGLYVVATRRDGLFALTPTGEERWSLARPLVRSPVWTGTRTDTRIAYTSRDELRVVGGDGRGDVSFGSAPDMSSALLAWRPGTRHLLAYAYVTTGLVRVVDADARGEEVWSASVAGHVTELQWSTDGRLLLVAATSKTGDMVSLFRLSSRRPLSVVRKPPGVFAAAFRPGTHEVAILSRAGEVASVELAGRTVFSTAGDLEGLTWSQDGRWLLVGWPDADQWVFIRVSGGHRIRAVANVSAQFRSRAFPQVEGWAR
jgi:hypothetical protein